MIKQMAWNTFKKTGSIDACMELIQLENMEKQKNKIKNGVIKVEEEYGDYKNQGDCNCREEL